MAPEIETAAANNHNVFTGPTVDLRVLGTDEGGEANLTYTWALLGTIPASVSFSPNGTNAAKNTVATFHRSGVYNFVETLKDQTNQTVRSLIQVRIYAAFDPATAVIKPPTINIPASKTAQFRYTFTDQFGNTELNDPTFAPGSGFFWVNGNGRTTTARHIDPKSQMEAE